MKSYDTTGFARAHFTVGYAKVSEVVPPIVFTLLVFGFYMANYAWSTGFFTSAFTPLLASVFFASVLYVIVNTTMKVVTPRRDIRAFVELIGATLFLVVAAWIFVAFPLNFAHVADVVPVQFRFVLSWLTNDMGRIIVALVLLAGVIAFAVDAIKLVWRVTTRMFRNAVNATY